jgi:hypothetical protein
MTQIIVDLPWVQSTKEDVSLTTSAMRTASEDAVSLSSAPDVDSGSTDFMQRWDERRGDLADYLATVEELFQGIYDAFSMTSADLRDAVLDAGGAP